MAAIIYMVNESTIAVTRTIAFIHYLRPFCATEMVPERITVARTYNCIARNGRHRSITGSHAPCDENIAIFDVHARIDIKEESIASDACYRGNFAHGKIRYSINH